MENPAKCSIMNTHTEYIRGETRVGSYHRDKKDDHMDGQEYADSV